MRMLKKNRLGVNVVILVFLLSFYSAMAIPTPGVSYIPYSNLIAMNVGISGAISNKQPFYVGVASQFGVETPLQALCHRQGSTPTNDQRGCKDTRHTIDLKSKTKLIKVFYSGYFLKRTDVCVTEQHLIDVFKSNPLCKNTKDGDGDCCIKDLNGIVYLRIYEKAP